MLGLAAVPVSDPQRAASLCGHMLAGPWGAAHSTSCLLPVLPSARFVIQLLEDLVFFVSDVPNNGQNVLDIMVTKPNRERQKLMREQNILKQVCALSRGLC